VATVLNRERTFALLEALDEGATMDDAAAAAGVSRSTVYRWAKLGRQPGAPRHYQKFAWRLEWGHWPYSRARAEAWFAERAEMERAVRAEIERRRFERLA
jgi:transposase